MPRLSRPRVHIVLRSALAVGLIAGAGAGVTAANAASAPATEPALRLLAATPTVTVHRGKDPATFNPGVHIVAGRAAVDVRTTRRSYAAKPVTTVVIDGKRKTLPDGLVTDFAGLSKFLRVTVKDGAGKTVLDQEQTVCLNGEASSRMRPDAPATSPYAPECGELPFALGAVHGLQAGWGVNPAGQLWRGYPLDAPAGEYTAELSIAEQYRTVFGIPAADASKTVKLIVVQHDDGGERALAAAPEAHDHGLRLPAAGGPAPESMLRGLVPKPGAPARRAPQAAAAAPQGTKVPAGGPLPDLAAVPAFGIAIDRHVAGVEALMFGANVWNAGPAPLVVDGFRRPGQGLMDAYQYFHDAKGNQVGYAPAGTMQWDERVGHEHWHFTDFARYRLLGADKKAVVRSEKEAFCLVPTDAIDLTVKNANSKPGATDLRTGCGAESSASIRQTLDVGWGDTYTQILPGQSFDLKGLPNGTYYIEVTANPAGTLYEASTSNNVALRKVVIGGEPGKRTVEAPPHDLVNDPALPPFEPQNAS